MNKDWYQVCKTFAELTSIPVERAVGLSLLLWIGRDIGDVSATGVKEYPIFIQMLEGKKPFQGRWSKSEERKKTKGTVRPDDDPTCYAFKDFWDDYDHKKSFKESKAAYSKLGEEDRLSIKNTIGAYVADTPDKRYRLHACTYINQRRWEDYRDTEINTTVPESGAYVEDYKKYLFENAPKYTILLSYQDYESLRNEDWRKSIKSNVGPSILRDLVRRAHADRGSKTVYEKFLELLKAAE